MGRGWYRCLTLGLFLLALVVLSGQVLKDATLKRADLVIGNGAEPQSLDPASCTALPESRVLHCLFEGLVAPDPETLKPGPAMAESWSISPDRLTVTFRLRPNLQWSDGHKITASDLRWSYLRFLDPQTGAEYAYLLWAVKNAEAFTRSSGDPSDAREAVEIRVADERTLVFKLERPTPWFIDLMSFFAIYPVPRHVVERLGPAWVKEGSMVSNGPFRLRLRRLKDRIRVERNPFYWDSRNVSLKTIDLLAVESKTTLLNLYVAGKADWICDIPETAIPEIAQRYGPDGSGEYDPRAYLGTYYLRLNTQRIPFTNAKVRRALSLAVDRESLVKNITRAGELPAQSFAPPGISGYQPPRVLSHDRKEARRLFREGLEELGLKKAPPIEYLYNTRAIHRNIAEVLQHYWRETLGLEIRLRNMDWGSFQTATRTLDYMIARASWYGDYNDPNTFADLYVTGGKNNQTGFSDAKYDRIVLEESLQIGDPVARARILAEAERRLLEKAPIIPLFHDVTSNLVKPWVTGFHRNIQDLHPPKLLGIAEWHR